jgi:DNA polymerase/3'-5' exonuclease PolX
MSFINIKTIDDLVKKADIEINSNIANILRRLARLQNNIWDSANYLQIAKNVEELDLPITEIPNIMVIKGMTSQIEEEIKEFISIGRIERLDITTKKDGPRELEIQYALLDDFK